MQPILYPAYALANQGERLGRVRQGKEIVEVASRGRTPAQVLRDQRRINALDQRGQRLQVALQPAFRRTETEADAVQAYRVIGTYVFEHVPIKAAGAEIVLAMNLQPAGRGVRVPKIPVMSGAQPYTSAGWTHCNQPFFLSIASLPGSPWVRLPPICTQVPDLTTLKSFGS